jgi:DNA primase small subunit
MLRDYYRNHLPLRALTMWLGQGASVLRGAKPCGAFRRREFAFRWGDRFRRFATFDDEEQLAEYLYWETPGCIDLGAVYSDRPSEKLLQPHSVAREFVLDFDLTDMASVHTNRTEPGDPGFRATWRFVAAAVCVLDRALREDFGFEHLLWVFSGGRGVHVWVADERAMLMTDTARTAVLRYLQLPAEDEYVLHPALQRAADTLHYDAGFGEMLQEQRWLAPERRDATLARIRDARLRERARAALADVSTAGQQDMGLLWTVLRRALEIQPRGKGIATACAQGKRAVAWLVLRLCYPVLDANVSTRRDHLLKMPFAVHPRTGRVCVALEPATVAALDPAAIPTLTQLCEGAATLAPFRKTLVDFVRPLWRARQRAEAEAEQW